jgi:hypothetical protein
MVQPDKTFPAFSFLIHEDNDQTKDLRTGNDCGSSVATFLENFIL